MDDKFAKLDNSSRELYICRSRLLVASMDEDLLAGQLGSCCAACGGGGGEGVNAANWWRVETVDSWLLTLSKWYSQKANKIRFFVYVMCIYIYMLNTLARMLLQFFFQFCEFINHRCDRELGAEVQSELLLMPGWGWAQLLEEMVISISQSERKPLAQKAGCIAWNDPWWVGHFNTNQFVHLRIDTRWAGHSSVGVRSGKYSSRKLVRKFDKGHSLFRNLTWTAANKFLVVRGARDRKILMDWSSWRVWTLPQISVVWRKTLCIAIRSSKTDACMQITT